MNVLHVTNVKNVDSILKYGIQRRVPFLSQFREFLEGDLGGLYNKKAGTIFTIPEDVHIRDKYLKDTVYWKIWGTPRNYHIDREGYTHERFYESSPSIFKNIKLAEEKFVIFEVALNGEVTSDCLHAQHSIMSPVWNDMDHRYEHDDLPLKLINNDIPVSKIKIIGNISTFVGKRDRINALLNL